MLAIIDYNAGNIKSVRNAFERLSVETVVTDNPEIILSADKVIFPGVGEASSAMNELRKRNLDQLIPTLKQPVLGVCLGLQLMCKHSEENDTLGLGIFDVEVKLFPSSDIVPHMGWNNLVNPKGDLFQGITSENNVYFVHSYYAELHENTLAECEYIVPFSASLARDNFYAVQFHPEKSGINGAKILENFLKIEML